MINDTRAIMCITPVVYTCNWSQGLGWYQNFYVCRSQTCGNFPNDTLEFRSGHSEVSSPFLQSTKVTGSVGYWRDSIHWCKLGRSEPILQGPHTDPRNPGCTGTPALWLMGWPWSLWSQRSNRVCFPDGWPWATSWCPQCHSSIMEDYMRSST